MTYHHASLVSLLDPEQTPELTASVIAVLKVHAWHANESALSWPLISTIQRETRLSPMSITRAHRVLEQHGWIVRKRRHGTSTIYRLNVAKLERYRAPLAPRTDPLADLLFPDERDQKAPSYPQGDAASRTPADLHIHHSDGDMPSPRWKRSITVMGSPHHRDGENLQGTSKEHPSSSLSSSAPQQPTPQESGGGGGGDLPAGEEVVTPEAREMVRGLPWERVPTRAQQARLARLVARAFAAGWTSSTLRRYLTAEVAGVRSLYAVWTSRLEQLPEAPPAAPAGSRPGAPAGPVTVIAECPGCERGFRVALGEDGQPVATHCRDCREAEAMTSPDLAPVSA